MSDGTEVIDTQTGAEPAAPTDSLLTGQGPTDAGQQEPAAQAAGEGDAPQGDTPEVQGAPEVYEPFVMPDGLELDEEVLTEFQALAKEDNLSQEKAQKYADFGAKLVQKTQEETVGGLAEQWQETLASWVTEIKTDKELGGENLPQAMAVAQKAVLDFGGKELVKVLEETGMTNCPALFRAFYKAGLAVADDSFHAGKSVNSASKPLEQVMYPTMQ